MLRAQEAAKKAKEVKEKAAKKEEEERKIVKELRTGGGFDMEKFRKMKLAQQ